MKNVTQNSKCNTPNQSVTHLKTKCNTVSKYIPIRLPITLADRLKILAKSYNISVSELIRCMINFSLENY